MSAYSLTVAELPDDVFTEIAQPRHVPTGTRQAADQTLPYRVIGYYDDGDGLGSILGRHCCGAGQRRQDIHFEADKLGH